MAKRKVKKVQLHKEMTNDELAEKIDWEGGVWDYLLGYCYGNSEDFNEPLRSAVDRLAVAAQDVRAILDEHGASL